MDEAAPAAVNAVAAPVGAPAVLAPIVKKVAVSDAEAATVRSRLLLLLLFCVLGSFYPCMWPSVRWCHCFSACFRLQEPASKPRDVTSSVSAVQVPLGAKRPVLPNVVPAGSGVVAGRAGDDDTVRSRLRLLLLFFLIGPSTRLFCLPFPVYVAFLSLASQLFRLFPPAGACFETPPSFVRGAERRSRAGPCKGRLRQGAEHAETFSNQADWV